MALRVMIVLMLVTSNLEIVYPYSFLSSVEHRRDALDFEDSSRLYYRSKNYLLLDKENSAGVTFIYLQGEKRKQYTANLNLNLNNSFAMQLGNYFIQFGSGLLIGKMQMSLADNFTFRSDKILKNKPFSPCMSGNPVYSFTGAAFSFKHKILDDIKIGLHSFYSYKKCFLEAEDVEKGYTSASLDSIQSHYYKKSSYSSAVYIPVWGGMASLLINQYISAHLYGFDNTVKSTDDSKIDWDYSRKNDESLSINKIDGYGFFLVYADRFIQFFSETAFSRKNINLSNEDDFKQDREYGVAYQMGCYFKNPCLKMSFIYKKRNSGYYAPYANSFFDNNIEEAFYLKVAFYLWDMVFFDNNFSAQRKMIQKNYEDSPTVFFKEIYSLTIAPYSLFPVKLACKIYARGHKQDERSQYEATIKKIFSKKKHFTLIAVYQKKEEQESSGILNSRLKICFYKYSQISLQYLYAGIGEKNPVYVTLNTIPGTSFPGKTFYKTASFVSSGYSLNYFNRIAAIIYGCEFKKDKIISQNINLFLSILF